MPVRAPSRAVCRGSMRVNGGGRAECVAGATIIGPRPTRSPSLSDYPRCDARVESIARELWGSGKISDRALPGLLESIELAPDFEFTSSAKDAALCFLHRHVDGADVYF